MGPTSTLHEAQVKEGEGVNDGINSRRTGGKIVAGLHPGISASTKGVPRLRIPARSSSDGHARSVSLVTVDANAVRGN